MPQMAPTLWLVLLLFIMTVIFLFLSSLYTISFAKNKELFSKILTQSKNWKL
uniref:ATP synthase complex subunit 8 n=1 Tax=Grandidierella fasciata TaxID=2614734 RepID=A0A5H2XW58_9CRUS|nr:ATP synthase F0 subunit 8 [Grandidierella fasciata]